MELHHRLPIAGRAHAGPGGWNEPLWCLLARSVRSPQNPVALLWMIMPVVVVSAEALSVLVLKKSNH